MAMITPVSRIFCCIAPGICYCMNDPNGDHVLEGMAAKLHVIMRCCWDAVYAARAPPLDTMVCAGSVASAD